MKERPSVREALLDPWSRHGGSLLVIFVTKNVSLVRRDTALCIWIEREVIYKDLPTDT